ncbi:MAG TPA: ribonuclease J, partial [Firmicutes bacterium]|nr:ribonuclease J [Bacillota bacterium]
MGTVGNVVLRDRRLLAEDGIVVAVVAADRGRNMVVGDVEIVTRGFVYVKESETFIEEIRSVGEKATARHAGEGSLEVQSLKDQL